MSHSKAVEPEVRQMPRTYRVSMDPRTECYYLYLIETQGTRLGGEFWTPAGDTPTMIVIDTIGDTPIVRGIELVNPIAVRDEGDLFPWTQFRQIEFIVGRTDEELTTIVDGSRFDGTDVGEYPGLSIDYTPEGEVVAIRVRTFPNEKPPGIRKLHQQLSRVFAR